MKIAICQLNYHIGNFEENTQKIIAAIKEAEVQKAAIAVFAELSVCGYPPRDFLEFKNFIDQCEISVKLIAEACHQTAAIIGCPVRNLTGKGKPLFNAALLLYKGKIVHETHKQLLPTYDVFDEYRYFEPGVNQNVIEFGGERIALTICEDLWQTPFSMLYDTQPMALLAKQKPTLAINIAASPFHYSQTEKRFNVLSWNAKNFGLPIIYCNQVGAQTELIFDGGSVCLNAEGEITKQLAYFEEHIDLIETDKNVIPVSLIQPQEIERIHNALILGIKDYFGKLGFKKALIGVSGGIDSAVVLALAAEALGKDHVRAVLMPSQFSSQHSVDDAIELAENLGVAYNLLPIQPLFDSALERLKPLFLNSNFGLAEENLQARIRGLLLMAISNKQGEILLNTSNKSETAVGYGTLYGDMNGGLSVIGDVYKTQVYSLANYINKDKAIIPQNTLTKPPSAELRPNQKDSDSLPEYDVLDRILHAYIENQNGPDEIIQLNFEPELVKRVLKLVNTNEYKRHQTPPILRVSPKAFGMGRRMPIVGKYLG